MAVFDEVEDHSEHKKKTRLVIYLIVLMVVILGIITYLFFGSEQPVYVDEPLVLPQAQQTQNMSADSNDASALNMIEANTQNADNNALMVDSIPTQAQSAPVENPTPIVTAPVATQAKPTPKPKASAKPTTTSTVANLKYAIKPNNADIYECVNMRNGRWDMPKKCEVDILNAVQRLIDANNELIAIEISGIVDGNPYAGPSAELKQEGLASFRAREGIIAVMRGYSNVAAFEGPSLQARGKRGFQVKAYYLSK